MYTRFKLVDDNDTYYGSYTKEEDALVEAREMANEHKKDILIYKETTELLDVILPD